MKRIRIHAAHLISKTRRQTIHTSHRSVPRWWYNDIASPGGGKTAAAGALVGAVMKKTKGQADAGRARELIIKKITG